MQDWPRLLHRIIDHAATFHGERKVITRSVEGPIHTTNYKEVRARALKVAQRLMASVATRSPSWMPSCPLL